MKKAFLRTVALILVAAISVSMIVMSAAAVDEPTENRTTAKYQKISMESITGLGSNPEEISGNASSAAAQKQWYEYIMYSPQPVSSIRIDDNRRLIFYDPYDYGTAMIMKVTGEESEWSTANSISVSYTTGNTLTDSAGYSTNTSTSTQVQDGQDENFSHSTGTSSSATKSWSNSRSYSKEESASVGASAGVTLHGNVFGIKADTKVEVSTEVSASNTSTNGSTNGGSDVTGSTESTTDGWSKIAKRITETTGSSSSTNTSWSTNSSKTVNRTFNAGYYNANGAPLPWKIVQYTVYMPMKYELQCKFDGEWYSTDSDFCIITTIQGACRAYMKNTQTYVEHWGTGAPVLWDDFWGRFFTEDKLIQAYQNKLYPNN